MQKIWNINLNISTTLLELVHWNVYNYPHNWNKTYQNSYISQNTRTDLHIWNKTDTKQQKQLF